jgi:adenylate cyclase
MKIGQIALPNPFATLLQVPIERTLRLATGLTLFAFVISHFTSHAFGVRSVAAMQRASELLLGPWQTRLGLCLLYGALIIHALLGLRAFYRRRHLRIPRSEAWQLGLGLLIPLLLIPHAGALRIGQSAYGIDSGHEQLLYQFFVVSPDFQLPRQMLLLLVVWLHGCIGIRAWLRYRPWYARATPALASLATLLPVLALIGVINAGLDIREAVQQNPAYAARFSPPSPGSAAARSGAALDTTINTLVLLYLGLIAAVLALRAMRDWYAARFQAIRVSYPGNRTVTVPAGYSVLETSRWADIPHASVCGGRGRCSTCRVRIVAGGEALSAPSVLERATLAGIGAPEGVRLACQIRPSSDLTVEPLLRVARSVDAKAFRFEAAAQGGRELQIAAMFIAWPRAGCPTTPCFFSTVTSRW